MFCSYCGKKIPDDSSFCAHCGAKITVYTDDTPVQEPDTVPTTILTDVPTSISTVTQPQVHPPVVSPPRKPEPQPTGKEREYAAKIAKLEAHKNCFLSGWRSFITSPLVLIAIILQSISVVISLAGIGDTIEAMKDASDYIGDFAGSLMTLFSVGTIFVNVLLTVGMWMVYADGQKKDNSMPSTKGLSLIIAFVNIYYIGTVVLFAITGLISLGTVGDVSGFIIFMVMAGVAVGSAVVRWLVMTILENAEDTFVRGTVNTEKLVGIGVFSIVSGCVASLSLFTQFALSTLISSAFSILIGCVMLYYKNTLERIQQEQNKNFETK